MSSFCNPGADRAYYFSSLGYDYSVGYFAWENLILLPKAAKRRV